ncbi:PAS domain-containing protein [Magnetospirillum sp. ME-1]|uniref:PAS domain-containing protein n=1 Tax=Magnetospirillum sp. ME-1 TaxID=1639348 RepID=UPI001F2B2474|nr:PAS domain-containing protein [Magnetospirillum sp. ME-1]
MAGDRKTPSGRERTFAHDELIVSKTDPKGRLTYVNDVFLTVSGYTESEVMGKPHSVIRHPEMPRCVFKLLWDTIADGREIFAYVNNMAKNGDNYWVFAHVTPNFDAAGQIIGVQVIKIDISRSRINPSDPIDTHRRVLDHPVNLTTLNPDRGIEKLVDCGVLADDAATAPGQGGSRDQPRRHTGDLGVHP